MNYRILLFAFLYLTFIVFPGLFRVAFPFNPSMRLGDFIDLFTPFIMTFAYWQLFSFGQRALPSKKIIFFFGLGLIFWVSGHSIHLAANSISNSFPPNDPSKAHRLAYFYDEELGHKFWFLGMMILSVILSFQNSYSDEKLSWPTKVLAPVVYGFALFCFVIEGQVAILALVFASLFCILCLFRFKELRAFPLRYFFLLANFLFLLLTIAWGIYWGGFPEFSKVGII